MSIQTYRLSLVDDNEIPRFKRLAYEPVDVPLADVFQRGIHPESIVHANRGRDACDHTSDVIVERLNSPDALVPGLKAHLADHEVSKPHMMMHNSDEPATEHLLKHISENVYFVDNLEYEELLQICVQRLRDKWDKAIAREMTDSVYRKFNEVREFLKSKNPDIKLTGYQSLDEYDLSKIVSVDDFLTEERFLVSEGISVRNFRLSTALKTITDETGRLKLAPGFNSCVVEWDPHPGNWSPLVQYRCLVSKDQVAWTPTLTQKDDQRSAAMSIAQKLGGKSSGYCFTSSLSAMEEALKDKKFNLRLPHLDYKEPEEPSEPTAKMKEKTVTRYSVTNRLTAGQPNKELKRVLEAFNLKVSGKKDELVKRLVELIAETYRQEEENISRFFERHKFIRIKAESQECLEFPALRNHVLRSALLAMYCLRHMRGNVVLEAQHENDSVSLPDLAEAILTDRVKLTGCFVAVCP